MRQTKKFVAGYARLREIDNQRGRPRSYTHEELYRLLEEKKQVVVLVVVGSSPIIHPFQRLKKNISHFP